MTLRNLIDELEKLYKTRPDLLDEEICIASTHENVIGINEVCTTIAYQGEFGGGFVFDEQEAKDIFEEGYEKFLVLFDDSF